MKRVEGKVAFITGVARGQGRAHALALASNGANIIGIDALESNGHAPYPMPTQTDLDETVQMVEKLGQKMVGIKADVRDREALAKAVSTGVASLGGLDIVSAGAGISPPGGPMEAIPQSEWEDVLAVNLTGVFNTLAVTVPVLKEAGKGGSIICTSSGAGMKYVQNLADYNASKAGVVALAKTLANELAPEQIRVNALCPGTVNTPLVTDNPGTFKLFRPDLENPTIEDARPVFEMIMPMGHAWVEPEDVANALLFLASDESRYITGQAIAIDQGMMNRAV